jgi:hypothetical protein
MILMFATTQSIVCDPGPCHLASTGGSVLTYGVLAAAAAAFFAFSHELFKNRLRRAGIARLLYHRLLTYQSTLATAYCDRAWWPDEEFRESDLDSDDLKRVATALRANEWRVVNSALGWAEYLRAHRKVKYDQWSFRPNEDELTAIRETYERLELARWALRRVCARWQLTRPWHSMPWDIHNCRRMQRSHTDRDDAKAPPLLENVPTDKCKQHLRDRKKPDTPTNRDEPNTTEPRSGEHDETGRRSLISGLNGSALPAGRRH